MLRGELRQLVAIAKAHGAGGGDGGVFD